MAILTKKLARTVMHKSPYSGYADYFRVDGQFARPFDRNYELPLKELYYVRSHGAKAYVDRLDTRDGSRSPIYATGKNTNSSVGTELRRSFDSRLYATAYSKFVEAAQQGSAEWGMNIVQGRQALKTFVQLALTSAVTVATVVNAHKAGIDWLNRHRNATPKSVDRRRLRTDRQLRRAREHKERLRLSNLKFLLDQVAGTLLAVRYGVLPLMSDIASTVDILQNPFKDNVVLRKSVTKPLEYSSADVLSAQGTESVVLKATVRCSNPNLGLASRLGFVNPAVIVWDNTPWSFVVDWWFPVGRFLSNFTASVGLTFDSASVTYTRTIRAVWNADQYDDYRKRYPYMQVTVHPQGDMIMHGKRKVRTTGSLPIPTSVPYGTGLSIQRGQNALALVAQLLNRKIR